MTRAQEHPSRRELDALLLGEVAASVSAHVEGCGHCRGRLDAMREVHEGFLERYPTLESLPRRAPEQPRRVERSGARLWRPVFLGASFAAAAAVLVVALVPEQGVEPTIRAKGASIVELAVDRGGASVAPEGQPLRAGDHLGLRYTTTLRYLMLLSVEASGRVSIYLPQDGAQSIAIRPGRQVVLEQGVELDDYVGPERLIALLSEAPLRVDEVRAAVGEAFAQLGAEARDTLDLPPLPVSAEQFSWLLHKEAP